MNQKDFDDIIAYMTQHVFSFVASGKTIRRIVETDSETLVAVADELRKTHPDITIDIDPSPDNDRHALIFSK